MKSAYGLCCLPMVIMGVSAADFIATGTIEQSRTRPDLGRNELVAGYKFTARVSGSKWRFELTATGQLLPLADGEISSYDVGTDGKTMYSRQWWTRNPDGISQATVSTGTGPSPDAAPAVMWIVLCGSQVNTGGDKIPAFWQPTRDAGSAQMVKAKLEFDQGSDFLQSAVVEGPANVMFPYPPGVTPPANRADLMSHVELAVQKWDTLPGVGRFPLIATVESANVLGPGNKSQLGNWTVKTDGVRPLTDQAFVPPIKVAHLKDLRSTFVPEAQGRVEYMITAGWPAELPPAMAKAGKDSVRSINLKLDLPEPEKGN